MANINNTAICAACSFVNRRDTLSTKKHCNDSRPGTLRNVEKYLPARTLRTLNDQQVHSLQHPSIFIHSRELTYRNPHPRKYLWPSSCPNYEGEDKAPQRGHGNEPNMPLSSTAVVPEVCGTFPPHPLAYLPCFPPRTAPSLAPGTYQSC